MTPLILYLLKANLALLLFYLAYRYGLRKLTFYTLNRVFLLFAIIFSSVYPLISLDGFTGDHSIAGQIVQYLPGLENLPPNDPVAGGVLAVDHATANDFNVWSILTVAFWSGVLLMAGRFVVQLVSLARIRRSASSLKTENDTIYFVDGRISPFSFFRCIYINPELHSSEEQISILRHEQVHVRQWHTADIIVGEINRIFYWFNPGAWLIMTSIRENLEFITDQNVLKSGIDAKAYQYSLIKATKIYSVHALANSFNFSDIKIRITMMNKKRSSELHLIKYVLLLPLISVFAFAWGVSPRKKFTPQEDDMLGHALTDTVPRAGKITIYNGADKEGRALSQSRLIAPSEVLSMESTADSMKIFPAKDSWKQNLRFLDENDNRSENSSQILVARKHLYLHTSTTYKDTEIIAGNDEVLVMIDNRVSDLKTLQRLTRDEIGSCSLISGSAGQNKYGKKGENGVIEITTSTTRKK